MEEGEGGGESGKKQTLIIACDMLAHTSYSMALSRHGSKR